MTASICDATKSTTTRGADPKSSGTNPKSRTAPICRPAANRPAAPDRAHARSRSLADNEKHRSTPSKEISAGNRSRALRSPSLRNSPRAITHHPNGEPNPPQRTPARRPHHAAKTSRYVNANRNISAICRPDPDERKTQKPPRSRHGRSRLGLFDSDSDLTPFQVASPACELDRVNDV